MRKDQLVTILKSMNVRFTLNNQSISFEEVLSDKGLLPGLMRRADQLCSLCFGYGLGVTFDESEKATLGVQVKFDESTPNVLRYLCIVDVLMEIMQYNTLNGVTRLDELTYD